jgi:ribosomal-protein-alanine N-acetyltransferase
VIRIRPLELDDAPALLDLRLRNRAHLEPWEPARDPRFYTLAAQEEALRATLQDRDEGRALPFGILHDGELVGGVNLSVIVRGVFENAYLGYWIDAAHGGRGFTTDAVRLTVAHAFERAALHRVQAAVIPRNGASIRVLQKLGFREEGLALRYLRINGRWEDHVLFAVTREEWSPPGAVSDTITEV